VRNVGYRFVPAKSASDDKRDSGRRQGSAAADGKTAAGKTADGARAGR
jgi:hypothetical protein